LDIAAINEKCMQSVGFVKQPSLNDYVLTDTETRNFAKSLLP
jgi:hypothetical protein